MRLIACDVCRKTHPDSAPIGWIELSIVIPRPEEVTSFLAAIGARGSEKVLGVRTFVVCSTECLSAFAEMESLRVVT